MIWLKLLFTLRMDLVIFFNLLILTEIMYSNIVELQVYLSECISVSNSQEQSEHSV